MIKRTHPLVETMRNQPVQPAVNEQMLGTLKDFSTYVYTEQSSTDGQVHYSNTQTNPLAFKAPSVIGAAEAEKDTKVC